MESSHVVSFFDKKTSKHIAVLDWCIDQPSSIAADLLREHVGEDTEVFVRCSILKSIEKSEILETDVNEIIFRAGSAKCTFVYSQNYEYKAFQKISRNISKKKVASLIHRLRTAELTNLLFKSNAIYQLPENYYFRSPSNAVVSHFIRTGNIQRYPHSVDILFFWLLPTIKNVQGIIIDTWSISSTAYNLGRRLYDYADGEHRNIHIGIMSQYFDGLAEGKNDLNLLLKDLKNGNVKSALFLYSASASGDSLKLVQRYANKNIQRFGITAQCLSIYQLAGDSSTSLCNISDVVDIKIGDRHTASNEKQIYDIDPDSYFPYIVNEKNEKKVQIKSELCEKELCSAYGGKQVFHVHRNAVNSNGEFLKHHAVYIDVENALLVKRFIRKLKVIAKSIASTSLCIITKPHDAGKSFAHRLSKLTERPIRVFVVQNVSDNEELVRILNQARKSDNIIVVDDVVITGRSLSILQRQVRSELYKGTIDYVVGFTRCKSENVLNNIKTQVCWNDHQQKSLNKFNSVETLFLPDWNQGECPWCIEQSMLTTQLEILNLSEVSRQIIADRIIDLDSASDMGLGDNVFWLPDNSPTLKLGPNSLYVSGDSISQADVVVAVSTALQKFRKIGISHKDFGKLQLGSKYPLKVILTREAQFKTLWSDTILTLAIWRMARKSELRSLISDYESRSATDLVDLLQSSAPFRDLYHEISLGLLTGHLPLPHKELLAVCDDTGPEKEILTNVVHSIIGK